MLYSSAVAIKLILLFYWIHSVNINIIKAEIEIIQSQPKNKIALIFCTNVMKPNIKNVKYTKTKWKALWKEKLQAHTYLRIMLHHYYFLFKIQILVITQIYVLPLMVTKDSKRLWVVQYKRLSNYYYYYCYYHYYYYHHHHNYKSSLRISFCFLFFIFFIFWYFLFSKWNQTKFSLYILL